jgi:hypothetical protein
MAVERFPVEESHIMMFARAVADSNPIYADPEYAKGTEVGRMIAPPTFVQASAQFDPDYPLRPKVGKKWQGSGREATGSNVDTEPPKASSGGGGVGMGARGLHAEQHYEYHRHIGPGDVLSATTRPGERWEKEGKRGGKLIFAETITEYRDQNGELVITARSVGVETAKAVEQ